MPAESELATLAHQLQEVNRIGAALSAERDTARLLDLILTNARETVGAIEARDPATSGHSFRVANLTVALAEAADATGGRLDGVHSSREAVPIERALDILGEAIEDGELDPDLFTLFVGARAYGRWQVEPFPY